MSTLPTFATASGRYPGATTGSAVPDVGGLLRTDLRRWSPASHAATV